MYEQPFLVKIKIIFEHNSAKKLVDPLSEQLQAYFKHSCNRTQLQPPARHRLYFEIVTIEVRDVEVIIIRKYLTSKRGVGRL